jgi:hypothetical protein
VSIEVPAAGWRGLRVLITANDHRYYDQVVTITGKFIDQSGGFLLGELWTGEATTFREGEYKVVSRQD